MDHIENHMVAPQGPRYYAGQCEHCGAEFESSASPVRDEDGNPDFGIRKRACAAGDCTDDLCPYCQEVGEAFWCAACGELFCTTHKIVVCDEPHCRDCAEEIVPALRKMREKVEAVERALVEYGLTVRLIGELAEDAALREGDCIYAKAIDEIRGVVRSAPLNQSMAFSLRRRLIEVPREKRAAANSGREVLQNA